MENDTREIILDTETTGLRVEDGHRVVEIGAVETRSGIPTGEHRRWYLNPERNIDREAEEVHGLNIDFLMDKPVFADIADEFLEFLGESSVVAHNAEFDVGFLNAELTHAGKPLIAPERIIDTLKIARNRFPGAPATLDALCRRFRIETEDRTLHGALLDSRILARVYVELLNLDKPEMDLDAPDEAPEKVMPRASPAKTRPREIASCLTDQEARAHEEFLLEMAASSKQEPLWETINQEKTS